MAIIRGHHSFDDQFTQIPNAWLRDSRLSFKAIGLLAQIMSHNQGWKLTIALLADVNKTGKETIRSAVAELEKFGYLKREQPRDGGRFQESIWTTQDPDLPIPSEPMSGNPITENPTHKKNINKEQQPKEKQVKNKQENFSELFAEFWETYPRKLDKAKAERAFKAALKKATAEEIITGAIRYRDDPLRKPDFTKYPATWLNAEAWNNEPDPRTKALEEWLRE